MSENQISILFFGACAGENDLDYLLANESRMPQIAAHKVCWLFIKSFDYANGAPCEVLCSVKVSNYPHFRKFLAFALPGWDRGSCARGRYVPYFTVRGIRLISTVASAFLRMCEIVAEMRGQNSKRAIVIVTYSMYLPHMVSTICTAKIWGVKTLLIVPDLPEYMNPSESGKCRRFARKIYARLCHGLGRWYDGHIVFTQGVGERLKLKQNKFTVIEGIVDGERQGSREQRAVRCTGRRSILYAGSLDRLYGVQELLDAFATLPDLECDLELCGAGSVAPEVVRRAAHDSRIKFYGVLPNDIVLQKQRSATVLVNPRNDIYEFTKYSFPSKLLEYMMSGRPVITYRLAGIPNEYDPYLLWVQGSGPGALAAAIAAAMERPPAELQEIGARAKQFVLSNKNVRRQGACALDLIRQVLAGSGKCDVV